MSDLFASLYSSGNASMSFSGTYRYTSASELESAVAAVQELLEGEDEDFATDFDTALRRRGTELRVEIETECPSDWYYAYATLIEALAERAVGGTVEGTPAGSDHVESYVAAAASASLTKMKRIREPQPTWDSAAAAVAEALASIGGAESIIEDTRPPSESAASADSDDVRIATESIRAADVAVRAADSDIEPEPDEPQAQAHAHEAEAEAPAPPVTAKPPAAAPAPAKPDGHSVADRVSAATVELTTPPTLMRVPELMTLRHLMPIGELRVPQLVLIPELVPPADLSMITRSVTVSAGEMVTVSVASELELEGESGELEAALAAVAGTDAKPREGS